MTADDVRARFEAWARPQGFRMHIRDVPGAVRFGQYCDDTTQAAFEAYRAAHADLSGEVRELVEADRECDEASRALDDAKRSGGNWRINPLPLTHPATVRYTDASRRRSAALAKFTHQAPPA